MEIKKEILKSKKYICENDNLNQINQILKPKTKCTLESVMNSGKTYLSMELFKLRKDSIRVFITPRNSLGFDVERKFKKELDIKLLFKGNKIYKSDLNKLIITSPESFCKLIELLKNLNIKKELFMVYDEIHLAVNDLYRKSLFDILNTEKDLVGTNIDFTLLGLTATSNVLDQLVSFDKSIHIDIKEKFKPTDTIKIVQLNKIQIDELFVTETILKTLNENKGSNVSVRINNKALIEQVSKVLSSNGINTLIGTSDNSDDILDIVKNGTKLNSKVSLFTSYTEVGVEFNNDPNTILLDFEGYNNNNIVTNNIVQNIGRYRNGLKEIIIYVQHNKKSIKTCLVQSKKYAEERVKAALIDAKKGNINPNYITFDDEGNIVYKDSFEFLVIKDVLKVYNENSIRNAIDLKQELLKISTLNVENIVIEELTKEQREHLLKEYKEKIQTEKKKNTKKIKELKEEIQNQAIEFVEEDLENFEEENKLISGKLKKCTDILDEIEEKQIVQETYKELKNLYKNKLTNIECFKLALNYKNTNKKLIAIKNNLDRDFYKKNNIRPNRGSVTRIFTMQNHIMNIVERETQRDNYNFRLNKTLLDTILEECKYKEIHSESKTGKNKYKKLINILALYYNLDNKKNNPRILSKKDKYLLNYIL